MKLLVRRRALLLFAAAVCCAIFPTASTAADWPTAGGERAAANVSADALALALVEELARLPRAAGVARKSGETGRLSESLRAEPHGHLRSRFSR